MYVEVLAFIYVLASYKVFEVCRAPGCFSKKAKFLWLQNYFAFFRKIFHLSSVRLILYKKQNSWDYFYLILQEYFLLWLYVGVGKSESALQ